MLFPRKEGILLQVPGWPLFKYLRFLAIFQAYSRA